MTISEEEKKPEFVLIDERTGQTRYTYFASDSTRTPISSLNEEVNQTAGMQNPISLRLLCSLGLIFSLFFGLGILMLSIVMTSFSLITLFQSSPLNHTALHFWKMCFNTLVAAFGFAFGLISPTLGLGLLLFYFALKGNKQHPLMQKIFQYSFKNKSPL